MEKKALFDLSYGVYVVSTKDGDRNVGCVVNSIFQVTSSPATIAISINKDNYTCPCILKTGKFAISILSETVDQTLIGTFGFSSSKETDKFENVEFIVTDNGMPVLSSGTCSYIECSVINTMDCFTHTMIYAEIIDCAKLHEEPPMTYAYYHKVVKGKAPEKAPTYVEEEKNEGKKAYVCSVCGYIHDGSCEEFEMLPDSYTCPLCSAPKSVFEIRSGETINI